MPEDNTIEVNEAVEALRIAMLAADAHELDRLTDEDLLYGHTSGRTETKPQFIDGVVSGKTGYSEIAITKQIIRVVGNVAIVHQHWDAVRNNTSPGVRRKLAALNLWLRRGDHWKLLARQAAR